MSCGLEVFQRGIGGVSAPFIGPRREQSGRRGEQPATSVGFNGATISVPKGNREEGKWGAGEVVSRRLFEGEWEASRQRSREAAQLKTQGGDVAHPEEGDEGGVGQLGQFRRVVPNARWAGKTVWAGWKLG
jgi:hypothetical protein